MAVELVKPKRKEKLKAAVADVDDDYSGPADYVGSGGIKTVHVRSYTRKDGTVIWLTCGRRVAVAVDGDVERRGSGESRR